MINFNIEQPGDVGVLKLEGSFGIQDIEELKSSLVRALQTVDKVFVDIKNVSDVDISCLELFCSVHRTSVSLQKTLAFSSTISEPFRKVVSEGGFKRHVGCVLDVYKTCLWVDQDRRPL